MSEFLMVTAESTASLLADIVAELVAQFGISRAEAVARVNQQWKGQDLSAEDDIILHEDAAHWATFIYFGGVVRDWRPGADRSSWPVREPPPPGSDCWTVADE